MAEPPAPRVSRRPRVSLIWVVPILAALVAGWMMWREWHDRGPEIVIHFEDGSGLEPNQTRLRFKGVEVGAVTDVALDEDLAGVTVRVRLRQEGEALARRGSEFWIVHPRIGFSGVSGLETIVAGVHLNVRPGNGPPVYEFRGLERPPAVAGPDEGRAYRLLTNRVGAMQAGAPVYYRNFQVGEVETIGLGDTAENVLVGIRVRTPYVELVRHNSRFWNAGGVPLEFSLFGGELRTASLSSFFTGAIEFATPDMSAGVAPENTPFRLFAAPEEDWLEWHPKIPVGAPDPASPPEPTMPGPLPGLLPAQTQKQ